MNRQSEFKNRAAGIATRALWFGAIVGLVLGFAAGCVVGYQMGSDTTVVIPLSEGVKV